MRSYRSVKRVAVASVLIVIATVALTSGIAADPPVDHCTLGEVTSALQAWAPGVTLYYRTGLDYAGLAEGVSFCQYRTYKFWVPEVCFCEDDIFLGGTTYFVGISKPDGMSLSEASEWLNQLEVQVELDGSPIDVVETAVKGAVHPAIGQIAWQQHGVLFQLPPGEYVTTYRDYHPDWGDEWWEANVTVRVLPHETAHDLGPPSERGLGSVQCPED